VDKCCPQARVSTKKGSVDKDAALLLFFRAGTAVSEFFIDFSMQKGYEGHAKRAFKKMHPGIEKTPFCELQ